MGFLGSIGAANNLLKVGRPPNRLNWFIFDMDNLQLISTTTVPDNISDSKGISHVAITVPGLAYKPMLFSGLDNKKLAFTLKAVARNNVIGNQLFIQQIDTLRRPKVGLLSIFADDMAFNANPKVLYHYGAGTIMPLVYFVTKCTMAHSIYNNWGYPQVTEVQIELTLDEDHILNTAEDVARKIATIAGTLTSAGSMVANLAGVRKKPY